MKEFADIIFLNGNFTTLDPANPSAEAVAIHDGIFLCVGTEPEVMKYAGENTVTVDLNGEQVLPGLHDSHTHFVRGGLNYNLELRWDGVYSFAEAMRMLKEQAERTPQPQWVRVVGGFSAQQFDEKRLPTLEEINSLVPDTPVFILHLYDRALLNKAAIAAIGITKDTPNPAGGEILHDYYGNPTGLFLAKPNARILYETLSKAPRLSHADQLNSTRVFMQELNRLGITSVIDAGGGFQRYPEDYAVIRELWEKGELTVRTAYNIFPQQPNRELSDFNRWTQVIPPLEGDSMLRHNGAGEMLVFSATDFEDFREPRPEPNEMMEKELEQIVRLLVEKRWPFRLHATYNETIERALNVFERINEEIPFNGLHWFFDHAETITVKNINRVKALGGGIAIQHRMAYQGEYFASRYGSEAASLAPPVRSMLEAGLPVGAGTDATRVAGYNPWICLYWLVSGKTLADTGYTMRTISSPEWKPFVSGQKEARGFQMNRGKKV
ncbi:amidohydrolase [Brucepastera parasyntrophica]|uniref:amidohydrolase n=1 Tax=Brucepastera parasyntrophica TaxID=2880008 RepID=UPI00210D5A9E|nr:amidohydrolase [Brucepastera parasyntrophica]